MMNVKITSIEGLTELLEKLLAQDGIEAIFKQTIWIAVEEEVAGDVDPKHAVVFEVILHVSFAVSADGKEGYTVEFEQNCGRDYRDATKELNGTVAAEAVKEQLATFCDVAGLSLLPGILEA